jgi:hypothetical protein
VDVTVPGYPRGARTPSGSVSAFYYVLALEYMGKVEEGHARRRGEGLIFFWR